MSDDPKVVTSTQLKVSGERVQQTAAGVGKWFSRNLIPGSRSWKDAIDEKQQRKARNEELGRKQAEQRENNQPGSVSKGGDSDFDSGPHFTSFQHELVDSLRRSFPRDDRFGLAASEIRETLTDPMFIAQVLNQERTLTPRETVDGASAEYMLDIRRDLASQLQSKVIRPLSAQHLEVLFTCMVGRLTIKVGENEEAFWDKAEWHKKGKMSPDEVFFSFLERTALKQPANERGDYIGGVLKAISESRAIGKLERRTNSTLMDVRHVDRYLRAHSDEPIERTVAEFKGAVEELFSYPSTKLHPVLGVPGLGYVVATDNELNNLRNQAKKAKEEGRTEDFERIVKEFQEKREKRTFVEQQIKTLEVNFREYFISRIGIMDILSIPQKFENYTNPELATILEMIDKISKERNPIPHEIEAAHNDLRASNKDTSIAEISNILSQRSGERLDSLRRDLERLNSETDKLAGIIAKSNLPGEIKSELGQILADLKGTTTSEENIANKKSKVIERYAHPFKKAAKLALDNLVERSKYAVKDVPDLEWIQARVIFEDTGKKVEDNLVPQDSAWTKWERWFNREVLSLWIVARTADYLFWNGSEKNTGTQRGRLPKTAFMDFYYGRQKIENRDRDNILDTKNPHAKILGFIPYRRWMRGTANVLLMGYVVFTASLAYSTGQYLNHYAANQDNNWKLWVFGKSRIVRPWQWAYPVPKSLTRKRIYGDHYDIPDRLQGRGGEYYTMAYGISSPENLRWIGKNKDVLTFLQERVTRRRVTSWKMWEDTDPGICSNNKTITIPDNCKKLGITSLEHAEKFNEGHFDIEDGWKKGNTLCCTLDIEYENLDERMLNKGKVDEFINYLKTQADSGVKIDYAYLTNEENMLRWSTERFLVPSAEYITMELFGIKDQNNAMFLVAQKKTLDTLKVGNEELLISDYVTHGNAPRYLKPEAREEFFTAYREAVKAEGIDPTMDLVPEERMKAMFEKILQEKAGLFDDTGQIFRENQAKKKMEALGIKTQTGKDIYLANDDIRKILNGLLEGSLRLDPTRADELVYFLSEEKKKGTKISRYDPAENGDRVEVLRNKGYFVERADFAAANQTRDEPNAASINAYFANNAEFGTFLDALIEQELANNAVLKAFGGDVGKAKETIRSDVFRILKSENNTDISRRTRWGIAIEGEKITYDPMKARTGIGNRIRELANASN